MRALMAAALLGLAGCTPGPLFVDQVEDGRALLIDEAGGVHHGPASQLPADAGEGDWIGAPPDAARASRVAALRAQLAKDDDGAPLSLH